MDGLHNIGARCWYIEQPFDLLVVFRGKAWLAEVKAQGKDLREKQRQLADEILERQGYELPVWHSLSEAVATVTERCSDASDRDGPPRDH